MLLIRIRSSSVKSVLTVAPIYHHRVCGNLCFLFWGKEACIPYFTKGSSWQQQTPTTDFLISPIAESASWQTSANLSTDPVTTMSFSPCSFAAALAPSGTSSFRRVSSQVPSDQAYALNTPRKDVDSTASLSSSIIMQPPPLMNNPPKEYTACHLKGDLGLGSIPLLPTLDDDNDNQTQNDKRTRQTLKPRFHSYSFRERT